MDEAQGDKGVSFGKPGKARLAERQLTRSGEERTELYMKHTVKEYRSLQRRDSPKAAAVPPAPLVGRSPRSGGRLGRPWAVILITLLIFMFSQFMAAVLIAIGANIAHPDTPLATALSESAPVQFFYILVVELLAIGLVVLIVKKIRKTGLSAIGLGRLPRWHDASRALLGAGAFYLLLIVSSIVIQIVAPDIDTDAPQDVGFGVLNTNLDYILAFAGLAFLPPIGEEILMRGYLYSGLRVYWKILPAMLVTSLIFGVAHLGIGVGGSPLWLAGVATFLLSLVLVYLRERTGALYAGMMLHSMNNIIAFTIQF